MFFWFYNLSTISILMFVKSVIKQWLILFNLQQLHLYEYHYIKTVLILINRSVF